MGIYLDDRFTEHPKFVAAELNADRSTLPPHPHMPNFTPRPTLYKGIQMRSRLEAGFAAWLDSHDMTWEYEPEAQGSLPWHGEWWNTTGGT